LTMQHALGTPPRPAGLMPPGPQTPPSRPYSTSALPQPLSSSSSSKPAVKVTPSRRRASSEPLSPSTHSKTGTVQCNGVTKAGKQCTRQVKSAPALSTSHPDAQIERFCHQHSKELLGVAGFYSHKIANEYIKFQGSLCYVIVASTINLTVGCKIGFQIICNQILKLLYASRWRNLALRLTFRATSTLSRSEVNIPHHSNPLPNIQYTHRPQYSEESAPQSGACRQSRKTHRPMGQTMRVERTDPPRVVAWGSGR
jgi:hypothetical protein